MAGVWLETRGLIAVCEARPYWTPALQRELQAEPFAIRGCRLPSELDRLITAHRTTMVVCDLDVSPAGCLTWLASRQRRSLPIIIYGSPITAALEPVCRELGATSFLPDLISQADMAVLCRRWFRILKDS